MLNDFQNAIRTLRRQPRFVCFVVLILGLGIGANCALFAVINSVFLRRLPYSDPEQIIEIGTPGVAHPLPQVREAQSIASAAALTARGFDVEAANQLKDVSGMQISSNLFDVLGVRPEIGRPLTSNDAYQPVVVLSDSYWRRISGDPGIIGQTLMIDGIPHTVAAVLPPDFILWFRDFRIFIPKPEGQFNGRIIARRRPGVSNAAVEAEMSARFRAYLPDPSRRDPDWHSYVRPASESFLPRPAENLWLIQAGLALILLIVSANAASLQTVRSNARRKEFAIRAALGAGRRLFRQVVYEGLILGCSGGLLGILIASWSLRLLQSRLPDLIERSLRGADPLQMDYRVAAFATAITIGASVIFAVIPVIPALRVDIIASLRTNAKGDTVESHRRGGFIVAGEIALAVALLTGAGITVKSMIGIERHSLGFNSDHVLSAFIERPSAENRSASERAVAFATLLRRLESVPAVESAGIMGPQTLPFGGPGYVQRFTFFASPGYFASLRIPLLTGRFFTEADTDQSAPVAIVSESVAQRVWGHMNPIGQSIHLDPDNVQSPRVTIVGVVGNIRNPLRSDTQQTVYRPLAQSDVRGGTLMVRGAGDLARLSTSIRDELRAFDPHEPEVGNLTDIVMNYNLVTTQRFATWMFVAFGLTGLSMATLGVYGLMGQWVSVRIPEIGIRMALGAEPSDIVKLVLARCGGPAICGLGFGAVCALFLEKAAATQFYGVAPFDLPAMLSAIVLMAVVALLAAALPARRAAAINPGSTLRNE